MICDGGAGDVHRRSPGCSRGRAELSHDSYRLIDTLPTPSKLGEADPNPRWTRAKRNQELRPELRGACKENLLLSRVEKVWKSLNRVGITVARYPVECPICRLLDSCGSLAGVIELAEERFYGDRIRPSTVESTQGLSIRNSERLAETRRAVATGHSPRRSSASIWLKSSEIAGRGGGWRKRRSPPSCGSGVSTMTVLLSYTGCGPPVEHEEDSTTTPPTTPLK